MEKGRIEFDDPTFRETDANRIDQIRAAGASINEIQREVRKLRKECEEKGIELPDFNLSDDWGVDPIDMILLCPSCKMLHVDKPEEHDLFKDGDENISNYICDSNGQVVLARCKTCHKAESELDDHPFCWDNPPHKSHLCRVEDGGCGTIWRPADVPTNGVAEIKTKDEKDTWAFRVQSTGA